MCPLYLSTLATLPCRIQKVIFNNNTNTNTNTCLINCVISELNDLLPWLWTCPPIWKMPPRYRVKCRTCSSKWSMLFSSRCWWLGKEPLWLYGKLKVRQTTSQQVLKLQSDHLPYGHTLPVYFTIDQLHHKFYWSTTEIQPMFHAATFKYRGLGLDTHAPASCPRCCNLPDLHQDCRLAT